MTDTLLEQARELLEHAKFPPQAAIRAVKWLEAYSSRAKRVMRVVLKDNGGGWWYWDCPQLEIEANDNYPGRDAAIERARACAEALGMTCEIEGEAK